MAYAETPPGTGEQAAKAHFLAGSAYFQQGDYASAHKELLEAHRLSSRPDLLFNIAVCEEKLERWDDAIEHFKRYLIDKPNPPDRAEIEARIAHAEEQRDAALAAHATETPAPVAPPPAVIAPAAPLVAAAPPASRPPLRKLRLASFVLGGLGGALLIGALGTGVAAQADYNHLSTKCTGFNCPDERALRLIDQHGARLAATADALLTVGAVSLATGVVLFVIDWKRQHRRASSLAQAAGY